MTNYHGTLYIKDCNFSVNIQNKLFYKINDNMTISSHSSFLLNSTLLFPEYSLYSIQGITTIVYIFVRMSTTSHVHSKLILVFYIKPIKRITMSYQECFCICIIYLVNSCTYLNDICITYWLLQRTKFVLFSFLQLESTRQWNHGFKMCE